jgi:hypothetical protein
MFRATALMFGDQAAMILAKLADTIDQAQQAAYELGLQKGQENLEAACDASFDNGYSAGYDQGQGEAELQANVDISESGSEAYDNGYLQGVQDARAMPGLADENAQDIIIARAEEFYDEYDWDPSEYTGFDHLYANYAD